MAPNGAERQRTAGNGAGVVAPKETLQTFEDPSSNPRVLQASRLAGLDWIG